MNADKFDDVRQPIGSWYEIRTNRHRGREILNLGLNVAKDIKNRNHIIDENHPVSTCMKDFNVHLFYILYSQ